MHLNFRGQQLKVIVDYLSIYLPIYVVKYKLRDNHKPKIYNRYTHKEEKGIQT